MGLSPRLRKLLFGVDITEPLVEQCDDCWQVHNIRDVCPIPDVKIRAPKTKEAATMDPDKAWEQLVTAIEQLQDEVKVVESTQDLADLVDLAAGVTAQGDDLLGWLHQGGSRPKAWT